MTFSQSSSFMALQSKVETAIPTHSSISQVHQGKDQWLQTGRSGIQNSSPIPTWYRTSAYLFLSLYLSREKLNKLPESQTEH